MHQHEPDCSTEITLYLIDVLLIETYSIFSSSNGIFLSNFVAPLDSRRLCIASILFTLSYRVILGELNLEVLIMHFFLSSLFMSEVKLQDETIFAPHFTIVHKYWEPRRPVKILHLEDVVCECVSVVWRSCTGSEWAKLLFMTGQTGSSTAQPKEGPN